MLRLLLLSLLTVSSPLLLADTPDNVFDDSEILHAQQPEWFKDSFLDLEEDLREVKAAEKMGLMLYFGTEGCAYCRHFIDRSLGNPDIARRVQRHFDSIALEMFDDSEMVAPDGRPMRVKEFAKRERAEFSPTVVFLDSHGRRLLQVVGYYSPDRFKTVLDYVVGGLYERESFRTYVAKTSELKKVIQDQQELIQDNLFVSPPYALDRSRLPADRPLLVLFEQKNCVSCTQFHQTVLKDPTIRALLVEFEVVQLDIEDQQTPVITPQGKRTTPATWAKGLDFMHTPSLVFFDENGEQVLKVDTLVLHQRMANSLDFVLKKAHKKGMTYQRFARTKAAERFKNK